MCERVFKGNIVFTNEFGKLEVIESAYIVVADNKVVGVYRELPSIYSDARVFDYGDRLIVPGLVTLDLIAPEFGLGHNHKSDTSELSDTTYAEERYIELSRELRRSGMTRTVLEGTIYMESNMNLMDVIAKSGLGAFVSNSVSDNNGEYAYSLKKLKSDAEELLIMTSRRYENVKPMLSVSLSECCSKDLIELILSLSQRHNSKLKLNISSSGLGEIPAGHSERVMVSFESKCNMYNLSESSFVSISERSRLKPSEIESGIRDGLSFGLSSSGTSLSSTISSLLNQGFELGEVLYLATKGGGAFFGKVGAFEEGYEFDAIVLEDSNSKRTPLETLEAFLTSSGGVVVSDLYISGQKSLGL